MLKPMILVSRWFVVSLKSAWACAEGLKNRPIMAWLCSSGSPPIPLLAVVVSVVVALRTLRTSVGGTCLSASRRCSVLELLNRMLVVSTCGF